MIYYIVRKLETNGYFDAHPVLFVSPDEEEAYAFADMYNGSKYEHKISKYYPACDVTSFDTESAMSQFSTKSKYIPVRKLTASINSDFEVYDALYEDIGYMDINSNLIFNPREDDFLSPDILKKFKTHAVIKRDKYSCKLCAEVKMAVVITNCGFGEKGFCYPEEIIKGVQQVAKTHIDEILDNAKIEINRHFE